MQDDRLRIERAGGVAILTFDDPASLNAIDPDLALRLSGLLTQAEREARAALLTGAGRGFCSGANLSAPRMSQPSSEGFDAGVALEEAYNPLMRQLAGLAIPIVTAVNGAAAGVGCSLALMGDLILAAESAYFLQAFRRIGLVPDGGSTWVLPRRVGMARAMEMMLLGEKIHAAQALEWGLINRVVPDGELPAVALELAQRLAEGPASLGLIRRAAWRALDQDFAAQLQLEREFQREAGRTADFVEGVSAFLQKRPAKFEGR